MTRVVGVRWRQLDPVSYAIAGDFLVADEQLRCFATGKISGNRLGLP